MAAKRTIYIPPTGAPQPTIGIRGHKVERDHVVKVKPHVRHTKYGNVQVGGYTKTVRS